MATSSSKSVSLRSGTSSSPDVVDEAAGTTSTSRLAAQLLAQPPELESLHALAPPHLEHLRPGGRSRGRWLDWDLEHLGPGGRSRGHWLDWDRSCRSSVRLRSVIVVDVLVSVRRPTTARHQPALLLHHAELGRHLVLHQREAHGQRCHADPHPGHALPWRQRRHAE